MTQRLTDAFGEELSINDEVDYAGTDHNRKPTINRGVIDLLDFEKNQVRVIRQVRSGRSIADENNRRVWVDTSKVLLLPS